MLTGLGLCALPLHGEAPAATGAVPTSATSDKPSLYAVLYAHLDTQWRWEYPHTINEYLPATLHDNFALFEKYPDYVFNFTGANRYRMMKEYYPADYARLKGYVASGRWYPGGSSMEEGDVNLPKPEAVLRQVLYGNEYFRREFGQAGADFMLPDSFGFSWSLPSVLAHCGIKGFSTGKLEWGSSIPDQPTTPYGMKGRGVPFNFGRWVGPDGQGVVSALHPGGYLRFVTQDFSRADALDITKTPFDSDSDSEPESQPVNGEETLPPRRWLERLEENREQLGAASDYAYYGTGDIGGAPNEGTVAWIQRAVSNRDGAIRVLSARSDQFFRDITKQQAQQLPQYSGEMLLTNHSAGVLTSQAYQKRWMRRGEVLADAAEKASVAAELLGVRRYPLQRLNEAWTLMLAGHFHDIAAGVATPKAQEYAWNDAVIAMNQMAGIVTDASEGISALLDTQVRGTALVLYNALEVEREDAVEAMVDFPNGLPRAVRVVGPDGVEVPAQLAGGSNGQGKVIFIARVPAVGYAVYGVQAADAPMRSTLRVTQRSLENERYRIRIDEHGDLASLYDKPAKRELLLRPVRLAIRDDMPKEYPAWNMDWADQIKAPRAYVGGVPKISISEQGAARVGLTIERRHGESRFVQTIRLSAGDGGNRVEIRNVIDWREPKAVLKSVFAFTAANDQATYNLGVGAIERATASERKFEVPAHEWIDLSDRGGEHGVMILTGDKYGSDKTDERTIALTLLRTPGIRDGEDRDYIDQTTQDWGRHEILYGLAAHSGDWRAARTDSQAFRLDTPLTVFAVAKHTGALGKRYSLLGLNSAGVRVMALKKAERSAEYIVRVVESAGRAQPGVRVSFAVPILSAREVDGQEQPLEKAVAVTEGVLSSALAPYQIRSFALTFATPAARQPDWRALHLDYDCAVSSNDGAHVTEGFHETGAALPAEMLPAELSYAGVNFKLGPAGTGLKNAVSARGQTIELPPGRYNRLYLLAASAHGDAQVRVRVGERPVDLTIQDWSGFIGQWDRRSWKRSESTAADTQMDKLAASQAASYTQAEIANLRAFDIDEAGARATGVRFTRVIALLLNQMRSEYAGLTPGYIKRAPIAWYASHRHTAAGANEAYAYSYLYAYAVDIPYGAKSLTLPHDERVRLLAVTVGRTPSDLKPAWPLYDTLERLGQ